MLTSPFSNALSPNAYYSYGSGRYGLGINRRTWQAGQTIGRAAKRWLQTTRATRAKGRKTSLRSGRTASKYAPSFRGAAVPAGGGDSKSSFVLTKPMRGKLPPVASEIPPSYVVNNGSGRVESIAGQQEFYLAGDYYTVADVNLGFTLLGGAFATPKVMLKNVRGETLITNQENVNARVTVYDVLCKKDTNATISNPLTAITGGTTDAAGGVAADYNVPGYSPFMAPRFTEWFKVLQSTEVILSPGQCHSHVVTYTPNRYMSKEQTNAAAGTGIGGLTLYVLVQFHGTPINDVTTQTQVSLSHVSLDWVQKETYKYQYIHNAIMNVDVNQSLPVAFTVAGNTMQDDGTIAAEAEA